VESKKWIYKFALVLIVLMAGCATSNKKSEKADSWNKVNSANEFIGTWEGSASVLIPENRDEYVPGSSIDVSIFLEYMGNTNAVNASLKKDMNRFLTDWVNVNEIKQMGIAKDQLWEMFLSGPNKDNTVTDVGNYFMVSDLSGTADDFLHEKKGAFFINGNGTQLKMVFHELVEFGMGDSGITELILNKK